MPGLARPPTSLLISCRKDVGGRPSPAMTRVVWRVTVRATRHERRGHKRHRNAATARRRGPAAFNRGGRAVAPHLAALPPPQGGRRQRRGGAAVLPGGDLRRVFRHHRSVPAQRALFADAAAADPPVRRRRVPPLRLQGGAPAQRGFPARLHAEPEGEDPRGAVRQGLPVQAAGPGPDRPPPDRRAGRGRRPEPVPAGHRPAGPRPVVPHHLRHPRLADHRAWSA